MDLPDEKRLADLIWRSFKLKILLLTGSLICLLLVSSALRSGRKVVADINRRSVEARMKWTGDLTTIAPQSRTLISNPLFLDPSAAEVVDETEFRLYSLFVPVVPSKDPKEEASSERLRARCDELSRFIEERQNAYNLEFGISNLKGAVLVNALLIIDLWPLLLVVTLALVTAITLRQRAYEIILSNMIRGSGDTRERAIQSAFTGFLAGELRVAAAVGGKATLVYLPSLILLPEPLITLCLLSAVLYFSIGLPATEMPTALKLTSTVFGYHTVLILVSGLLLLVLLKTKSYYDSMIRAATGARVLSWIGFQAVKATGHVRALCSKEVVQKRCVYIMGTVAVASLFLPWIGNWRLLGFQFFLPQKPITQTSPPYFYKIEPFVMREIRIQLAIALGFVVLMLLSKAVRRGVTARAIRRVCYYLSFAVLAMTVNFLVFLLLLAYNSQRAVIDAVFTMLLGPGGSVKGLDSPRGIPLVLQYPMYGFFIFVISLAGLTFFGMWQAPRISSRVSPPAV